MADFTWRMTLPSVVVRKSWLRRRAKAILAKAQLAEVAGFALLEATCATLGLPAHALRINLAYLTQLGRRATFYISCIGDAAMPKSHSASTAFVLACAASTPIAAQEALYKGATINFVISADAGNSYDMFGRMITRHLPKHLPGSPVVIAQNMPGAGGLRATNWMYNVAPKDGNTIGMVNNTLAFDPLYGNKQAQFDASKFNWLGSPSKENALLIVWHTVPVKTLEDARSRELVLSATGAGSTPAFFARVLSSLFDLKVRVIPGYKSQTEGFLAMERGENDGNASPFWSSLNSEFPHWLAEKKIRPIVYYGTQRVADIGAPHALDLLKDPEKRATMQIAQGGLDMGRPTLAPPGVDPAKVAVLRKAMSAMFADETYKAECAKVRLNCASPSSGEELSALVQRIYASPRGAVEKISAIYMEGQGK